MATHRKKVVVSLLVTPNGSLLEDSTGQIRENASIIFTNFVGRSYLRVVLGLTPYRICFIFRSSLMKNYGGGPYHAFDDGIRASKSRTGSSRA